MVEEPSWRQLACRSAVYIRFELRKDGDGPAGGQGDRNLRPHLPGVYAPSPAGNDDVGRCRHARTSAVFKGAHTVAVSRDGEIAQSSISKEGGKFMKLRFLAAFAVISAVLAVPAKAHHSFNTFFDMSKTIAIEGVVTSFKLVSPHSEMLVDVPDPGENR